MYYMGLRYIIIIVPSAELLGFLRSAVQYHWLAYQLTEKYRVL
jgi:hypothetical protein